MNKILLAVSTAVATSAIGVSAASADTTHNVESGDTLNKIAAANNTDVDTIANANNISNINLIFVGQQLRIPTGNTQTVAPQTTTVAPTTTYNASETQSQAPVAQTTTNTQATAQTSTSAQTGTSDALQALINRESSGNVNATNGQFYGIGQLSPQARAMYGGNSTDYNDQLNAMKSYITDRYGSAENALAHSNSTGWY